MAASPTDSPSPNAAAVEALADSPSPNRGEPPQGATPRGRKWLVRLVPYALAATALAMIMRRYPPSKIAAEMARGHAPAMVPYALALVLGGICLISASDRQILRCIGALSFWRVLKARAAALVLALIGYAAGVGAHGMWVARATGCGAGFAGGITLYVIATDLIAVCLV